MKRRRDKALECNSFGQNYRPDGTLAQRRHTRRYTELFTDRKGVTRERVRTDETRHTFAGSFESVSGRGWIYHFDGGYVTMTDGEAHYFARDYQGSTRAVYTAASRQIAPLAASADGAAAANGFGDVTVTPRYTLEQATDYYPTGLPVDITAEMTDAPASSAATDRLHIGNRWINHAGLGYYDNTARYFDVLTVRFTAADQLEWKTPQLSPWSHCAGNPVNFIDPSGMEFRLNGNPTAISMAISIYDRMLDGTGTVNLNNEGLLQLKKVNHESARGALAARILQSAIDSPEEMSINFVENSDDVLIGDGLSSTVDIADIYQLGSEEPMSASSTLLHETYEQYDFQIKHKGVGAEDLTQSHFRAIGVEQSYTGLNLFKGASFEMPFNGSITLNLNYSPIGDDSAVKKIVVHFVNGEIQKVER